MQEMTVRIKTSGKGDERITRGISQLREKWRERQKGDKVVENKVRACVCVYEGIGR